MSCQLWDGCLGRNRLRKDLPVLISRERDTTVVPAARPFRFTKSGSGKGKPSRLRPIYPLCFVEQRPAIGTEDLKLHLIARLDAKRLDP